MILNVDSVSFSYQYLQIFRNLSFQAKSGQVVHVKGVNGTGKTTLLELISGLQRIQKGRVYLECQTRRLTVPLRQHAVYLCAETNGLYGQLTALENLYFWGKMRNLNISLVRVKEDLAKWGFKKDFFINYLSVGKFSKGMKRRLSLARVFSSNAHLLLLDEPTAGLDEEGRFLFKQAIKSYKQEKKIIVLVSHDIGEVECFVDNTINLKKIGR